MMKGLEIFGKVPLLNDFCLEYCPVVMLAVDSLGGVDSIIESTPGGAIISEISPILDLLGESNIFDDIEGTGEPNENIDDVEVLAKSQLVIDIVLCNQCPIVGLYPDEVDGQEIANNAEPRATPDFALGSIFGGIKDQIFGAIPILGSDSDSELVDMVKSFSAKHLMVVPKLLAEFADISEILSFRNLFLNDLLDVVR